MKCITQAWDQYESELRLFLHGRLKDHYVAEDLLHDVFLKAINEGQAFCNLDNTRAWLYRVTRNRLTDYQRTHKPHEMVSDQLPEPDKYSAPLVHLSQCLPAALKSLSSEDREIIELCDLEGLNQAEYARRKDISLAGAKSRIQRARKRLKQELNSACKIIFDEQGKVCCFDPQCK
jgi:RNA polymerase sigma-70 factor, ECF subfamily